MMQTHNVGRVAGENRIVFALKVRIVSDQRTGVGPTDVERILIGNRSHTTEYGIAKLSVSTAPADSSAGCTSRLNRTV